MGNDIPAWEGSRGGGFSFFEDPTGLIPRAAFCEKALEVPAQEGGMNDLCQQLWTLHLEEISFFMRQGPSALLLQVRQCGL